MRADRARTIRRTPISDFELTIERDPGELGTFCWDGQVEPPSATRFRARVRNFVPKRELAVYFLTVAASVK